MLPSLILGFTVRLLRCSCSEVAAGFDTPDLKSDASPDLVAVVMDGVSEFDNNRVALEEPCPDKEGVVAF